MNDHRPQQPNILLVDDNPQNLATLSRILTEQGYQVRTAISGAVALKSIQNMTADLILLDILMPEMDGYDVCRRLKAENATWDIPILFLSALDKPLDKVKAFEAGGVDYITKPFQTDEVLARVRTHLNLCAMQQQLQTQNRELAGYRDHLEDLVAQRTTELTRTNHQLQAEVLERERMAQALQVSEEQYRLLAEHVKNGILIVQQGQIVFANAILANMLQQLVDQLYTSDPLLLFPETARTTAQTWLHAEEGDPPATEWQVELVGANGQRRWVEIEQSGIIWNSHPACLLTIRDIHQGKLHEMRLEQERAQLQQENRTFKSSLMERYRFGELVGKSPAMQRVYELLVSAAASDVNVLIVGESGTGKELIARTLHQVSARKAQAFVAVNCASIPETLFEREFFGHRRGSFTGADRDKPGFFDRAHQGVLFLDEVTELSSGMQAKLLRVLQDGEYTPLGSTTPKQADVLIVAATNQEWKPLVQQGRLREDFFYRVCVLEIQVPPLRERKEDLSLLIEHFLERLREKHQQLPQSETTQISATLPGPVLDTLYAYNWPGNVRELQNVLQRYIATQHLDMEIPLFASPHRDAAGLTEFRFNTDGLSLPEAVKAVEKQLIAGALARNQQHKIKTAKMLGIPRSTLHRKIKEYDLLESSE
jgi:PAS domain S-box-containing protein